MLINGVPARFSTSVPSTLPRAKASNVNVGRCIRCYAVIAKSDHRCYVCGDQLPKYAKAVLKRQPVSTLTNLVFLASLLFAAYCFFAEHKLSLPAIVAISSALLLLRILAEQVANKNSR